MYSSNTVQGETWVTMKKRKGVNVTPSTLYSRWRQGTEILSPHQTDRFHCITRSCAWSCYLSFRIWWSMLFYVNCIKRFNEMGTNGLIRFTTPRAPYTYWARPRLDDNPLAGAVSRACWPCPCRCREPSIANWADGSLFRLRPLLKYFGHAFYVFILLMCVWAWVLWSKECIVSCVFEDWLLCAFTVGVACSINI